MKKINRTKKNAKSFGYALIAVVAGWGYAVQVFKKGEGDPVQRYDAGDAHADSASFATGQVDAKRLRKFAESTAAELLDEHKLRGPVEYDHDLESELSEALEGVLASAN